MDKQATSVTIDRARALIASGSVDAAKHELQLALSDLGAHFHINLELGELEKGRGDLNAAAEFYSAARTARPSNPWPYLRLAEIQGDLEQSRQILQSALANVPDYKNRRSVFLQDARLRSQAVQDRVDVTTSEVGTGSPIRNAALVAMVKDESDIIYSQLCHHYKIGLRYFVISDNESSDATCDEILRFRSNHPEAIVLILRDPVVGYYQDIKTTALSYLAKSFLNFEGIVIDWIFPLDADEFIIVPPNGPDLYEILHLCDKQSVRVLLYYLCDTATNEPVFSLPAGACLTNLFTLTSPFLHKAIPKVAYRIQPSSVLNMGNHFVDGCAEKLDDVRPAADYGMYLKHFPIRSVSQARSKYINGGAAYIAAKDRDAHGSRWRKSYAAYQRHGDVVFRIKVENYIAEIKASLKPAA